MPGTGEQRIPVNPRILIMGIDALHPGLGRCLERRFERALVSSLFITVEELIDGIVACLDEAGFFRDRMREIEQIVSDAREVLEDEDISVESFKRDVAENIVRFGDTPEMAYVNAVYDWRDAIGAEELGKEEWWDEDEDDWDYDEEEEEW